MTVIDLGDVNKVKDLLAKEPLEDFSVVERKPTWITKEGKAKYNGFSSIWGNFKKVSCPFNFITNDKSMVDEFELLFKRNRQRFSKGA